MTVKFFFHNSRCRSLIIMKISYIKSKKTCVILKRKLYGKIECNFSEIQNTKSYQTSVFVVNIPSKKLSGGIHFMGNIALPPFL